jgi:hypothetical protein
MKKLTYILLLVMSMAAACNKQGIAKGTPSCVKQKIKTFEKQAACSDASVKEYTFQGKTVYVFEPGTCGADMTSEVISSGCSSLGFLGGFTGNTKINGEDFSKAEFVETVWKK